MKKVILLSYFFTVVLALNAQHNYDDQGDIFSIDSKVGIGISNPTDSKLTINSSGSGYVNTLRLTNSNGGAGTGPKFILGSLASFDATSIYSRTISANSGNLIFQTNDGSGLKDRLSIDLYGNVGIGISHPHYDAKLTIKTSSSGYVNSIKLLNDYGGAGTGSKIIMGSTAAEQCAAIYSRTISANSGNIVFQTNNGNGLVDRLSIWNNGKIGIGVSVPNYELDVLGTIRAREIKVDLNGADFVFEDDYELRSLEEVESFVTENKHLPEIAPASEMEANGTNLGELNSLLLQKIEELTLYMIEMNKTVNSLVEENSELKEKIEILEAKE